MKKVELLESFQNPPVAEKVKTQQECFIHTLRDFIISSYLDQGGNLLEWWKLDRFIATRVVGVCQILFPQTSQTDLQPMLEAVTGEIFREFDLEKYHWLPEKKA